MFNSLLSTHRFRQAGLIDVKLGAVLVVIAIVLALGVNYLRSNLDSRPNLNDEPKEDTLVNEYERWRFEPINAMDTEALRVYSGTMFCAQWGRFEPFERERRLLVGEDVVVYEDGETEAFLASTENGTVVPAELPVRFEWWRGRIEGNQVTMEGWYTASSDTVKTLSMTGVLEGDNLTLEGERGPRDCTVEATADSSEE